MKRPCRDLSLRDLLHLRSRKIKDPAGRNLEILEDARAEELARQCGLRIYDLYVEALSQGICPYRYMRNREMISTGEQLKLAKSQVAVVGAGGLGGQVILLLVRLGIGRIVVADGDSFDESNLNRQALSNKGAMGKSKSREAVAAASSINPGVLVSAHEGKITRSNALHILKGSHVVVDALDNVSDRFLLEDSARKLGIPLVHGALAGFEGRLMTIFPGDPGLTSLYGGQVERKRKSKTTEAVLGVPTPTPSIIASLQVMEVLKILLDRGRVFRNIMLHLDLEMGEIQEFVFEGPKDDP